jgi:glycosyltransferase involved in cell wall biosynthesis
MAIVGTPLPFMKLIIQIPCLNEEETLGETLRALPRTVEGCDSVEWLIINDGSTDGTVDVARAHGVDHIVDFATNRGLAKAFMAGIERALEEGADIVVNTDADNQYDASCIPDLVRPIIEKRAQVVVGSRPIWEIEHFSPAKKLLQKLGTWVVRFCSNADVDDATSGFRAFSREAVLRLNIFDGYTYTLESIIQAGRSGIRVVSVPISVNGKTRPSRLVRSIPRYVGRSSISILRSLFIYRPGQIFLILGSVPMVFGAFLLARWLILYFGGTDRAHVPSLVAAAIAIVVGSLFWLAGLLGVLHGINRRLLEDMQYKLRSQRLALYAERRQPAVSHEQ